MRKDGTPTWNKRHIDGPGVWVSCVYLLASATDFQELIECIGVKGKEKKTVGEIYDVFESVRPWCALSRFYEPCYLIFFLDSH